MIAHSAFIIVSRKLAADAASSRAIVHEAAAEVDTDDADTENGDAAE
jgi:hypothetical protein